MLNDIKTQSVILDSLQADRHCEI